MITVGVLVIVATGGGDGDGSISVRNFDDDHTYWVGLYQVGNSGRNTIQSTTLDDYNALDGGSTDTFENVPEGDYYIVFKVDNFEGEERNRTGNFRLDNGEWECFSINDDGELHDCG
jgi:hypothetical protein